MIPQRVVGSSEEPFDIRHGHGEGIALLSLREADELEAPLHASQA